MQDFNVFIYQFGVYFFSEYLRLFRNQVMGVGQNGIVEFMRQYFSDGRYGDFSVDMVFEIGDLYYEKFVEVG